MKRASISSGLVAFVCMTTSAESALAADDDTSTLQEIVVTAQKREQGLQNVGVSVTAITAQQLQDLSILSSKDISKVAPSVVFDSGSSGDLNAFLSIRGISQSDFSNNQESPNSVYLDDVYVSSPNEAAFNMYDMEQIEVLRGPQGTLFGRNSTGGLANFITAKPTSTFEGYTEVGGGSFNQAYVEAAVSGPITDKVRVRLSGRDEENSGWWKNNEPGGHDTMERRFRGIRAQLEADVTDRLLARLIVSYDENPRHKEGTYYPENYYFSPITGLPAPQPANLDAWGTGPGNNFYGYRSPYTPGPEGNFNSIGFLENRRFAQTLALDWKFDSFTISSLSNYTDFSLSYGEDCDGGPVDFCRAAQGQGLRQWSEELRANGTDGPLTWTAGLYYLGIDQDDYTTFLFPALSGSSFAFNDSNPIAQQVASVASFGQIEWKFADQFRLTAGARYTHDHKTFSSVVNNYELGCAYLGGAAGCTGSTVFNPPFVSYNFSKATVGDDATENNGLVSGKLQLDYIPSDGKLVYTSLSRGVKGGGFNTNLSGGLSNAETRFAPETVYAYEIGSKFDLLDRRLRVNSSAFYYDYRNFQGYTFNGLQDVVRNYQGYFSGVELEVAAILPAAMKVSFGGSYLHSLIVDVPTAYAGIRDQQSILAPKWLADGALEKSTQIGANKLSMVWDFHYISERYASVDNNSATYVSGSFVHNARVTYDLARYKLQFAVGVDNIGNYKVENFAYDLVASEGEQIRAYAPPRWWHGSVRLKF